MRQTPKKRPALAANLANQLSSQPSSTRLDLLHSLVRDLREDAPPAEDAHPVVNITINVAAGAHVTLAFGDLLSKPKRKGRSDAS